MFASNYCKITKLSEERPISGSFAAAAFAGQPVQVDNAGSPAPGMSDDLSAFRLANNSPGRLLFLTRDMINPDSFTGGNPLGDLVFGRPNSFVNAVLVGGVLDAVKVLEIECEGGGDTAGNGQVQIETATVAGTIGSSGAGNATVIVTGTGITGSPLTFNVAVADNDTASAVAGKIRTALAANGAITALYTVGGTGATVVLTSNAVQVNDTTLNISVDNGTCSGLTTALASAATQIGIPSGDIGATYLRVAGTGAITALTPADTDLTIISGQWAVLTSATTQYKCGRLVKQIVPFTPGNVRIAIEPCEPAILANG